MGSLIIDFSPMASPTTKRKVSALLSRWCVTGSRRRCGAWQDGSAGQLDARRRARVLLKVIAVGITHGALPHQGAFRARHGRGRHRLLRLMAPPPSPSTHPRLQPLRRLLRRGHHRHRRFAHRLQSPHPEPALSSPRMLSTLPMLSALELPRPCSRRYLEPCSRSRRLRTAPPCAYLCLATPPRTPLPGTAGSAPLFFAPFPPAIYHSLLALSSSRIFPQLPMLLFPRENRATGSLHAHLHPLTRCAAPYSYAPHFPTPCALHLRTHLHPACT